MNINNNVIVICITSLIITYTVMKGLLNITLAKNSTKIINDNFEEVINNLEKFKGGE